jgi:hypothetical protein
MAADAVAAEPPVISLLPRVVDTVAAEPLVVVSSVPGALAGLLCEVEAKASAAAAISVSFLQKRKQKSDYKL